MSHYAIAARRRVPGATRSMDQSPIETLINCQSTNQLLINYYSSTAHQLLADYQ